MFWIGVVVGLIAGMLGSVLVQDKIIAANCGRCANTSTNDAREKFSAINCTGCYWRERCVCVFGGQVCRCKWEPKPSPVA
jgi:hypothetical protein